MSDHPGSDLPDDEPACRRGRTGDYCLSHVERANEVSDVEIVSLEPDLFRLSVLEHPADSLDIVCHTQAMDEEGINLTHRAVRDGSLGPLSSEPQGQSEIPALKDV